MHKCSTDVRLKTYNMNDVSPRSDTSQEVKDQIREREKQRRLAEAREIRKETKNIGISAADLIRADREDHDGR